MSQLVHMRQRIKAVETIKKITHAMRLISMSTHTRLRSKKESLSLYKNELLKLFSTIQPQFPDWHHQTLAGETTKHEGRLVIVVGSQKGLCGTFNVSLFSYLEKHFLKEKHPHTTFITIGKKAADTLAGHESVIMQFSTFSSTTLPAIVDQIIQYLLEPTSHYKSVVIVSNISKSFFIQYPTTHQLIPFSLPEATKGSQEEYAWEQSAYEILTALTQKLLKTTLHSALLESLVAEQAARFIAMDNSTRNASNLLETMSLEYNKTRQAKITRELTDLVSSFQ